MLLSQLAVTIYTTAQYLVANHWQSNFIQTWHIGHVIDKSSSGDEILSNFMQIRWWPTELWRRIDFTRWQP